MNSRIYVGEVMHARREPVRHVFRYPVHVYALDLAELPELDRSLPLFGYNRIRPVAVHDRDYLRAGPDSIRAKFDALLADVGGPTDVGRVVLVTAARYFHYVFNPVSFFYGFRSDETLACVVAQVNNTFGEMHVYVLQKPERPATGLLARYSAHKAFHVSPFFSVSGSYEFDFGDIRSTLDIRIRYCRDGTPAFAARLSGTPIPLDAGHLLATLARHPLRAGLTIPRILWQAARLRYEKKLPVIPKPEPVSPMTLRRAPPSLTQRVCASLLFRFFERMQRGRLKMILPDGGTREFGDPDSTGQAELVVRRFSFFPRVALAGEIGFGESYVDGHWDCDDLPGLLMLFVDNWEIMHDRDLRTAALGRVRAALAHRRRDNTLERSPGNVRAHYDVSNDFYRLFLDPTLSYSCAVFRDPSQSLGAAQRNKMASILEKAKIGPADHVLEIGCGWGSLALEAVLRTGCRVTGITLSREQLELARERVAEAGLEERISIELRDYRHIQGTYDRILSVEMLEAVGHRNLGPFFSALERALRPEGLVVLQTITIPDGRYDDYRRGSDWIRKYIFPGGHLPSLSALAGAMSRHSGLVVEDLENIGVHYARTLREWRERLLQRKADVLSLGFDEAFLRKWVYYFSYCEAGFATRQLNDLQLVLTRPGNRALPRPPYGADAVESSRR